MCWALLVYMKTGGRDRLLPDLLCLPLSINVYRKIFVIILQQNDLQRLFNVQYIITGVERIFGALVSILQDYR